MPACAGGECRDNSLRTCEHRKAGCRALFRVERIITQLPHVAVRNGNRGTWPGPRTLRLHDQHVSDSIPRGEPFRVLRAPGSCEVRCLGVMSYTLRGHVARFCSLVLGCLAHCFLLGESRYRRVRATPPHGLKNGVLQHRLPWHSMHGRTRGRHREKREPTSHDVAHRGEAIPEGFCEQLCDACVFLRSHLQLEFWHSLPASIGPPLVRPIVAETVGRARTFGRTRPRPAHPPFVCAHLGHPPFPEGPFQSRSPSVLLHAHRRPCGRSVRLSAVLLSQRETIG